jgi:hypothetical protein
MIKKISLMLLVIGATFQVHAELSDFAWSQQATIADYECLRKNGTVLTIGIINSDVIKTNTGAVLKGQNSVQPSETKYFQGHNYFSISIPNAFLNEKDSAESGSVYINGYYSGETVSCKKK